MFRKIISSLFAVMMLFASVQPLQVSAKESSFSNTEKIGEFEKTANISNYQVYEAGYLEFKASARVKAVDGVGWVDPGDRCIAIQTRFSGLSMQVYVDYPSGSRRVRRWFRYWDLFGENYFAEDWGIRHEALCANRVIQAHAAYDATDNYGEVYRGDWCYIVGYTPWNNSVIILMPITNNNNMRLCSVSSWEFMNGFGYGWEYGRNSGWW